MYIAVKLLIYWDDIWSFNENLLFDNFDVLKIEHSQ